MKLENIQNLIKNSNIQVVGLRLHSKASEKYVDVIFKYEKQEDWDGSIPYFYRRTGLFLETEKEIAELVEKHTKPLKKKTPIVGFLPRKNFGKQNIKEKR